jgi:hypothetical protein
MTCPHQSRTRNRGQFTCALGYFDGRPWLGNCQECIAAGNNTKKTQKKHHENKKTIKVSFIPKNKCCSSNYPSMIKMASNFTKAIVDETKSVLNSDKPLNKEEILQRINMCESCIFFNAISKRCFKCGCFINLKAKMRSQHCPIGKW